MWGAVANVISTMPKPRDQKMRVMRMYVGDPKGFLSCAGEGKTKEGDKDKDGDVVMKKAARKLGEKEGGVMSGGKLKRSEGQQSGKGEDDVANSGGNGEKGKCEEG